MDQLRRRRRIGSSTKNRRGEEGEQNTNQRTRDGKPEGNTPAGLLSGWICLHIKFLKRSKIDISRSAEVSFCEGYGREPVRPVLGLRIFLKQRR